jgi:hypothetical protein
MTSPEQAFPEQALLKRRRQILDDETGAAPVSRASGPEDASVTQDVGREDIGREDVWVKSFLSRLAGLVRDIGNRGK